MSNYCNQKGRVCHNCNADGYCQVTACSYPDATTTVTLKVSDIEYSYGRECQICGKTTDGLDHYICSDCKRKLNKLINGDEIRTPNYKQLIDRASFELWYFQQKLYETEKILYSLGYDEYAMPEGIKSKSPEEWRRWLEEGDY